MIAAIYVLIFTFALVGSPAWAGGWYLLLPPFEETAAGRPFLNSSAPLKQWQHLGSYDSARECEAAVAKITQWTVVGTSG